MPAVVIFFVWEMGLKHVMSFSTEISFNVVVVVVVVMVSIFISFFEKCFFKTSRYARGFFFSFGRLALMWIYSKHVKSFSTNIPFNVSHPQLLSPIGHLAI